MAGRSDIQQLAGLVLAGGRSHRMGEDKGALIYGNSGVPQVRFALDCLTRVCGSAWVSVNADQVDAPLYTDLPTIVDVGKDQGPAGGLLSAFRFRPDTAWLVLAVDMPRVSVGLLSNLVAARDASRIATVHRHADGTIEPLCAIWEAHARELIVRELDSGRGSLRALAEERDAAVAQLPEPDRIRNANTPAERSVMQQRLDADSDDPSGIGR
ncbi:MAG: molybdenum cofactor guanylyltransferase [Gammaproteobacteria bacterium]